MFRFWGGLLRCVWMINYKLKAEELPDFLALSTWVFCPARNSSKQTSSRRSARNHQPWSFTQCLLGYFGGYLLRSDRKTQAEIGAANFSRGGLKMLGGCWIFYQSKSFCLDMRNCSELPKKNATNGKTTNIYAVLKERPPINGGFYGLWKIFGLR